MESDGLVVRYGRKRGVAVGLLFGAIFGPMFIRAITSDLGLLPFAVPGVWMACASLWGALRARPSLLIDPTGLTFCRAQARLAWSEIAALEVQEWQGAFGLLHRLSVRAVHPEQFDAMWASVPRRPWIPRPENGRVNILLDVLSPSSKRIAEAVSEFSDHAFEAQVQRVGRRPFSDPDPV